MASPTDAGRITSNFTSNLDPWTVDLPASIAAGNLLIAVGRASNNARTFNLPSGWSWIVQNNTADATAHTTSVICRYADGSEGATLSWDLSGTAKGASLCWRITGGENPGTQLPEAQIATGTGANPDPPSIAPTGGSKDYLFLVFGGMDGEAQTYTLPASYSNSTGTAHSSTGGTDDTNCRIAGGGRALTASSTDPGAFTAAAAFSGWTAITIAVHPPAPVPLGGTANTNTAKYAGTLGAESNTSAYGGSTLGAQSNTATYP